MLTRLFCLLFALGCISSPAFAITLDELGSKVQTFEDSGQARFAPAAMKKIFAYQGAAMLAAEQDSAFAQQNETPSTLDNAIKQTLKVLDEANDTASIFQSSYASLLKLEQQAEKAYVYHHKPRMLAELEVEKWYQEGQSAMADAIAANELGQLNQTTQASRQATNAFNHCIDAAMQGLVEQTEGTLDQASSAGAKRYAPRLWQQTEDAFTALETYAKDLAQPENEREGIPRPDNIGRAMELAVYAQKTAIHAKNLYRDYGSFEKLMLDAKQTRLNYAQILDLMVDISAVDADVEPQRILQAIQNLKQRNVAYKQDIKNLEANFTLELEAKLQEQHQQDQITFQKTLHNIKSAYSSRLEQETFEAKRQNKLRKLFKKDEVDIITNIDGSLVIRAKKVQFAPNSSKVDGKYFEFFARIKEALALYPNRNIRIEGHTDSTGDAKENRKLSLARAKAVQNFLIAAGFDASNIKAQGYGEAKPVASNMYKKGRIMNRRIDIVIEAPHG